MGRVTIQRALSRAAISAVREADPQAVKPAAGCPGSSGVEQRIENPRVGGSIPPPGTILLHFLPPVSRLMVSRGVHQGGFPVP